MKVYTLTKGFAPGGYNPVTCKIFSTREKAEKAKQKAQKEFGNTFLIFNVEEWEVDE